MQLPPPKLVIAEEGHSNNWNGVPTIGLFVLEPSSARMSQSREIESKAKPRYLHNAKTRLPFPQTAPA